MGNIIDYLRWRGDLTLHVSKFNKVDSLILSQISYIQFDNLPDCITIRQANELIKSSNKPVNSGLLYSKEDKLLLELLAESRRFGNLIISDYIDVVNEDAEEQFSAVTIRVDDNNIYISFRGTDDTLVGWKEDLNMSFAGVVPCQKDALQYLINIADKYPEDKIRIGGHSKGGNMAVYAAAFCNDDIKCRISAVYNNDGPGFSKDIIKSPGYRAIKRKCNTFVPQSSIVGMLLEHEEEYLVVNSVQNGILQHDPYSWDVLGTDFVYLNDVSKESHYIDMTLKNWISELSVEEKKHFIDALYSIMSVTEAKTLLELSRDGFKNAGLMLKGMTKIEPETKKVITKVLNALIKTAHDNKKMLKRK